MSSHIPANLLRFARLLRGAGLAVTPEQVTTAAAAVERVGLDRREDVRSALEAVLVSRREELPLFERAFDLFWRAPVEGDRIDLGRLVRRGRTRRRGTAVAAEALSVPPGKGGEEPEAVPLVARDRWSAREVLRRKDFAELTAEEEAVVRRLLAEGSLELPPRRTRRLEPAKGRRAGRVDVARALRRGLARGGEVVELPRRRRRRKSRPLVVLCDVSGSMETYSRMLLTFVYTLRSATDRLEAFVFGTRLTRVTRELADRDPDRALAAATAAVVDWGGGTRIGEALREFNWEWGRRVLGRGAVVLLISDGWDRGDPELLTAELARLGRGASRLVWLNPLLGRAGYRPLTRGMRDALPFVDDFLPVHDLASLEELARVLRELGNATGGRRGSIATGGAGGAGDAGAAGRRRRDHA